MNKCILYTGYINKHGYGRRNTAEGGHRRSVLAHRAAYEHTYGPIPSGLCVMHRCDNRACVNPKHLVLGTWSDNVRDMDNKGRRNPARGERNNHARLTVEQVLTIKRELSKGVTGRELALRYDVWDSTISAIKRRVNWRWLSVGVLV